MTDPSPGGPPPTDAGDLDRTSDMAARELPGYALIGILGSGAMGVVYKARQLALDRVVAVKTVSMNRDGDATALARFTQEAVALARLQHPNIVQVYDSGHRDGRFYFAMELLAGEDLDARIDRAGAIDERTAWLVVRQVAAALAHAAAQGIFHRDVKPANLFLVPPPTGFPLPPGVPMVKVTDFGLALTRSADGASQRRLTQAGVTLGTPVYMAPEQFASPDVDHRADIYGLGATAYHMLTGRPPFEGESVWAVMRRKAYPVPPLGPPVSAASAGLVAGMMAADPDDRIAGYDDLLTRIDAVLAGLASEGSGIRMPKSGIRPPPEKPAAEAGGGRPPPVPATVAERVPEQGADAPRPPGRRRRWLIPAAVAGALAVVAVGAAFLRDRGGRPAEYEAFATEYLFDGESLNGWQSLGRWKPEKDEREGATVLAGDGAIRRLLPDRPACRVSLGLDLHTAATADVTVATTPDGRRVVLRVTRGGATLGRRRGDDGPFEPAGGPVVPYPAADDERVRYVNVQAERTPGRWAVRFDGRPAGEVRDDGTLAPDLRLSVDGGRARVEDVQFEELRRR